MTTQLSTTALTPAATPTFWSKVETFFTNIGHQILSFTENLATTIANNGGPTLVQFAEEEVSAAESAVVSGGVNKTGAAKFAAAQAGVVSKLEAAGIPVVMNAVNGAVEAAVANLNAGGVAATTTTATSETAPSTTEGA